MSHTDPEKPFARLQPSLVLDAVEGLGLRADGRLMALNSCENRVYRVGIEPESLRVRDPRALPHAVVAKFYRAARWSDAQIREEHAFALELAEAELAVAAPLVLEGDTLHQFDGYRFTLFECWPGGSPELDAPDHRAMLGRTLGRLHRVGARRAFQARPSISDWQHGERARRRVLELGIIPEPIDERYAEASAALVAAIRLHASQLTHARMQRVHGDCHLGNILWNVNGPLYVDFDDCLMGPAVQDMWMFCSGTASQQQAEWAALLDGYEQFAHFDASEASLVEPLRAMRMLNHAAWLAERWEDPAFPLAFPWFGEPRYWERHVGELREQLLAVEDPPLLSAG
ncbi:MAG: serine/threonine protein kinase [Gammaproteobacteria bacterium]|nr:serine/threonine protein kinase [Gammaproteobacteria bacterium]